MSNFQNYYSKNNIKMEFKSVSNEQKSNSNRSTTTWRSCSGPPPPHATPGRRHAERTIFSILLIFFIFRTFKLSFLEFSCHSKWKNTICSDLSCCHLNNQSNRRKDRMPAMPLTSTWMETKTQRIIQLIITYL